MIIRNICDKSIVFGSTFVVPGGTITLPPGYQSDHPMIQYFVKEQMIKLELKGNPPAPNNTTPPSAPRGGRKNKPADESPSNPPDEKQQAPDDTPAAITWRSP